MVDLKRSNFLPRQSGIVPYRISPLEITAKINATQLSINSIILFFCF